MGPLAETAENVAQSTVLVEGSGASLLDVLADLTQHHGLPFSKSAALARLPLDEGQLTFTHFVGACDNLGLSAKTIARKPSAVPSIVCPYVVLFKSGDVGLVVSKKSGSKKLSVKVAGTDRVVAMSGKQLDSETHPIVVYVTPVASDSENQNETVRTVSGHWLWSSVGRFKGAWAQVAIAALFVNILGLALPLFVMNVYDRVIPYNAIPTLWALAAGVVLALVFDFFIRMLRSLIIDRSGRRIDMKVSSDIFRHALDAKMAERPKRAGDIATQIKEFETVRDFFTSASLTSIIDLVFVGLFLFVLWILVGPLALVPLVAVPVVLIATLLIQIPLARATHNGMVSASNRHSVLIESLVGVETVKAIAAEGAFQKKWEQAVSESVRATSSNRFWSSLATLFSLLSQQAVSVIIIIWGVFLVSAGEISVGALIASNILAGRVLAPLGGIAGTLARLQQSLTSYRSLNRLMSLEPDHGSAAGLAKQVRDGRLELRDVSFSYPGVDNQVLSNLSLTISPGEKVGIIGRVGSGKSTLGKLLCGLYQTTEGAILLDDLDINHRNTADLRQAVCFVGQDPDLFSGSVRENILFANTATDEEFDRAALISGVASFVQGHPLGYQMPVGERGQQISGGQRQAVALARALVSHPKIMFLDEPTGAMDTATEALFVRNMMHFKDPATSLILCTHRTALLDLVDRVIVMDGGRIVSDGPKAQVLNGLSGAKKKPSAGGPNG